MLLQSHPESGKIWMNICERLNHLALELNIDHGILIETIMKSKLRNKSSTKQSNKKNTDAYYSDDESRLPTFKTLQYPKWKAVQETETQSPSPDYQPNQFLFTKYTNVSVPRVQKERSGDQIALVKTAHT